VVYLCYLQSNLIIMYYVIKESENVLEQEYNKKVRETKKASGLYLP